MTTALIVLNFSVFLLEAIAWQPLMDLFALWPPGQASVADTPPFHIWQLLTYSVLHANLMHIAFNMLGLYLLGRDVERVLGRARFLVLYGASVVSAGIVQIAVLLA